MNAKMSLCTLWKELQLYFFLPQDQIYVRGYVPVVFALEKKSR
jgi:hypothetical protein